MEETGSDTLLPVRAWERIRDRLDAEQRRLDAEQERVGAQPATDAPTDGDG